MNFERPNGSISERIRATLICWACSGSQAWIAIDGSCGRSSPRSAMALMIAGADGTSEDAVRAALAGIKAWLKGDDEAVAAWPGLAVLEPARARSGRHQAILLPFEALLGAIEAAR